MPLSDLSGPRSSHAPGDDCVVCGSPDVPEGGVDEMLLCDGCPEAFHQKCYDVPEVTEGEPRVAIPPNLRGQCLLALTCYRLVIFVQI